MLKTHVIVPLSNFSDNIIFVLSKLYVAADAGETVLIEKMCGMLREDSYIF